MEENNSKRGQLKTIVLLLIGFIIGFAMHAFTSSEEAVVSDDIKEAKEELTDEKTVTDENGEVLGDTASTSEENKEVDQVEDDKATFNATPNNSSNGGYSFSVADQSAGGVVYVSQLVFAEESWIAVREDNNGELGNILGAHRYPVGKQDGVIELLRNTEAGKTYYVVIYVDDGDKKFDHKKDVLLTDNLGDVTATIFRAY